MDISNKCLLHTAAINNNLEDAELLLLEKIDIYKKDKDDLTPLHILLKRKLELYANIHAKESEEFDTKGFNAIRVSQRKAIEKAEANGERHPDEYLYKALERDQKAREKFKKEQQDSISAIYGKIAEIDKFIVMLLQYKGHHPRCTKEIKLLNLHAACTLTNSAIADKLSDKIGDVNHCLSKNSPFYPGYTALHFAAHCNANTVQILVNKGANLLIKSGKTLTPLNICLQSFSLQEMYCVLNSIPAWQNILFTDGKTKLMDYIHSLCDADEHKKFVKQTTKTLRIPKNSPLWPGSTVLHIAVMLSAQISGEMLKDIVAVSNDFVNTQDCNGSTPVHLAFRQNRLKVAELLLKHQKQADNPTDKDNLTHLHIAAAMNLQKVCKIILRKETNVNVAYKGEPLERVKLGWTPLHVASFRRLSNVALILFEHGANVMITDSRGFTPIHLLTCKSDNSCTNYKVSDHLFASDQLKESTVKGIGLTHLHVATWRKNAVAVNHLLDLGSDIEATVGKLEGEEFAKFEGFRPIHIAMMDTWRSDVVRSLLLRGADIFAKKLDGSSPLSDALNGKSCHHASEIIEVLWDSEELQKKMEQQMGISLLHIACHILSQEKIEEVLTKDVNINARVHDDSNVWPGFTALHVLVFSGGRNSWNGTIKLCGVLLAKGADVSIKNAVGNTPALLALESRHTCHGYPCANFLLSHQNNLRVVPVNKAGMSHFHVACLLHDVKMAEKMIKQRNRHPSIDVNHPVNPSDDSVFAGQTPLHMALSTRSNKCYDEESQMKMIDFLLKHRANIHAVDAKGYTPLHHAASSTFTSTLILNKILRDNTDINKRANDGKTALEILLQNGASVGVLRHLIERGAKINSYNPISDVGYMAIVLRSDKYRKTFDNDQIIRIMLNSPDESDSGRNFIHNAVTTQWSHSEVLGGYKRMIKRFMELGCNIYQQDSQGRTALHLAVNFRNHKAIEVLLNCGADVNITDSAGKTPFSYARELKDDSSWHYNSNKTMRTMLAEHSIKLQLVGLQLSQLNIQLTNEWIRNICSGIDVKECKSVIKEQLQNAAKITVFKQGFTLRDFLHKTYAVNSYSLKNADRDAIDSYFKSAKYRKFPDLESCLQLQYRNVLARPSLIAPAVNALRRLLGFPLPDLCADIVLMHMTNFDLQNMIKASIVQDTRMIVD